MTTQTGTYKKDLSFNNFVTELGSDIDVQQERVLRLMEGCIVQMDLNILM